MTDIQKLTEHCHNTRCADCRIREVIRGCPVRYFFPQLWANCPEEEIAVALSVLERSENK